MKKLVKALLPLSPFIIFFLALTAILRIFTPFASYAIDLSTAGIFFTFYGVIYAILIGFLIVTVLQRFDALAASIEEELNAIEDVRDYLTYAHEKNSAVKKVFKALHNYVKSVINKEWREMSDITKPTDSDTSPELYDIMKAVNGFKDHPEDCVLFGTLVEKISDITTLRTKRIGVADAQLPPRLKFLLLFMSLVSIIGFVFMGIGTPWVHYFVVFSVVVSIFLMYMILTDLNTPFEGIWNIDKVQFEKLEENLNDLSK